MKALFKHLLTKPNNRGDDSEHRTSTNNLPVIYGKSPVKASVSQKYSSSILFSPSKTQPMVRGLMKPLGHGLLSLIFTAPQVIFGGNLASSNRVWAQNQATCPAGTTSTILDWNLAPNRQAIENQSPSAGPITATFQFTESNPGQVIDNQETRITSGVYGGQPGPNLEFNIGPQVPGQPNALPAPPGSSATLIINFSQPVQVEPLLLLDVDRDGERDVGFTFQDQVTVTASNVNTPVGVNLRAISPNNVRIDNNSTRATGINENASRSETQGNVEATITGAVTQIQIQYTAATEFGPPRQDETIGLARLNLCVPDPDSIGSIGDTVFNDRNGDGVQNQGEPGIPNVTLTLTSPGPDNQLGTADDTSTTTTTNENGNYRFENLPAGPYQVTVTPPDNFPEVTTESQQTRNLQGGQNLDDVDFGLRTGPVGPGGETNLRLVKRITGVFRNGQPIGGNFNNFVDDPNDDDDNVFNREQRTTPRGLTEFQVRSGDEVEYTIYFLGEGGTPLQNVRICDLVPPQTSFIPDAFASARGIRLQQANTDIALSNTEDGDAGVFYSPLTPLADRPGGDSCQDQNNPNGAVIVNINQIPPNNNFGLIRFRVKVD